MNSKPWNPKNFTLKYVYILVIAIQCTLVVLYFSNMTGEFVQDASTNYQGTGAGSHSSDGPTLHDMRGWQFESRQKMLNHGSLLNKYQPRGIVLCLHSGIQSIGLSLIRELECLGNTLPIEVHYCTESEMNPPLIKKLNAFPNVILVDVCQRAAPFVSSGILMSFQSYWIKPLAMIFSSFEEVLLLDADAMFMRTPLELFSLPSYQKTGALFFYDRPLNQNMFLNKRNMWGATALHQLLRQFNVAPFQKYAAVKEPSQETHNVTAYVPSTYMKQSFAYQSLVSHHQDSSVVVFNKRMQERAMHIMFYLITNTRFQLTFSWGDKEAFWLATELAHSAYSFSPWGTSVISTSLDNARHPNTLCGCQAHFWPDPSNSTAESLFYVNGRQLLQYDDPEINKNENVRFNRFPLYVSPRTAPKMFPKSQYFVECLQDAGYQLLPKVFHNALARRRSIYNAFYLSSDYHPTC